MTRGNDDDADLGLQAGFLQEFSSRGGSDLFAVVGEPRRNRPETGAGRIRSAAHHQKPAVVVEHHDSGADPRIPPVDEAARRAPPPRLPVNVGHLEFSGAVGTVGVLPRPFVCVGHSEQSATPSRLCLRSQQLCF
jgi:hypothetical protein